MADAKPKVVELVVSKADTKDQLPTNKTDGNKPVVDSASKTESKQQETNIGGVAEQTSDAEEKTDSATERYPVFIDGKILMISDIDAVKQTFHVRFQLNLQWQQAPNDDSKPELEIINLVHKLEEEEKRFGPFKDNVIESLSNLQPPNYADLVGDDIDYVPFKDLDPKDQQHLYDYNVWNGEILSIEGVNTMDYHQMKRSETVYSLTLGQKFYLKNFPFDCQKLPIKMRFTDDRYFAVPKFEPVSANRLERGAIFFTAQRDHLLIDDFKSLHMICAIYRIKEGGELDDMSKNYDGSEQIILEFSLVRNFWHYFWSYFVINFVLSCLGLCSFLFYQDMDLLNARLQLLFALVLTIVAEKFVTSTILPKLPYNTLLDNYLNYSFAYIILLSIMTAFVTWMKYHSGHDFVDHVYYKVNLYSFIAFAVIYFIFNIFFFMLCINRRLMEIQLRASGIEQYYNKTQWHSMHDPTCFFYCVTLRTCLNAFGCCLCAKKPCCAMCCRRCLRCCCCQCLCCGSKAAGKCTLYRLYCEETLCCSLLQRNDETNFVWVGIPEIYPSEPKRGRNNEVMHQEHMQHKYETFRLYAQARIWFPHLSKGVFDGYCVRVENKN